MTAYLLGLGVQVSVVACAALTAVALMRRGSAALRHWVLAAAVACAACLPVLQPLVPGWAVDVIPRFAGPGPAPSNGGSAPAPTAARRSGGVVAPTPSSTAAPRDWRESVLRQLPYAWAAGAAAGLALLFAGLARLAWLAKRARPLVHPTWTRLAAEAADDLRVRRPVRLLHSDHPAILAAWGAFRPRIVVPRAAPGWPEEDVRIVLRHEMAHIARGDWAVQLLAEGVRALNWFNPLVWLTTRRLRAESERACDDLVLVQGVGGPEYAERLLALARTLSAHQRWCPAFPASPMARPSSLERRIAAMLDATLNRTRVSTGARLTVAALSLAAAIPIAGLAVYAQSAGFGGTVFDPASRAVPNVTVTVTNTRTEEERKVRTDAQGRFEFAALPEGDYTFEARLPGFMTVKGTVTVTARGLERDLNLQLGSLQETVVISGRPAAAPPAAATTSGPRTISPRPPCTPVDGTGGAIAPPRKLHDVKPLYPGHLVSQGVSGPVVVEAIVGRDGAVHDLKVLSAPHPDLARAVLDAVGGWLFDPTLLNCEPVEVKMSVTARFELQ